MFSLLKNWAMLGLFLFSSFYSKIVIIKFCRCLDLNREPLVAEATALPNEPLSDAYFFFPIFAQHECSLLLVFSIFGKSNLMLISPFFP